MTHQSSGRPYLGYPQGSQDPAEVASDELDELENVSGRLLWPQSKPATANEDTNPTTDPVARSSSIVFEFGHDSPPQQNVPLAQKEKPPGKDTFEVRISTAADTLT
ncbi:hypothetical protein DFH28DRAFT_930366 [Melampsora americana]|nr:hypothetical protein DFH28DRAFT_930366 [Melampsora americana]